METTTSHPTSSARLSKGYLFCLGATFSWAFTGIFIRYLTENYQLPALVLAYWRDLFVALGAALALLVISPRYFRINKDNLPFLFVYGLVLAIFNTMWTFSVAFNGAAVATVLAYSSAAFTAILAWLLLKEPLGIIKLIAVGLGLAGCVLVSGAYDLAVWQLNPFGILTGIISGVCFSIYSMFGKVASTRKLHAASLLFYTFAIAAVLLLVANLFFEISSAIPLGKNIFWLGDQLIGWLILFILAVGPTVGGFGLYTYSLNFLPASIANLIAMLEPPLTAIMAYFLLAERLSPMQLVGSVLIISCVLIVRLSENR